ncbi:MAG TPA: sulfatase-like hydrolase/transferase [Thermoanaerobaculia bacterium]|jgi:arylsulfatase A-like enzyme/Tfp pilus assembly protein PilF|nr:sulfatase-like hydrolase/transferase [Thermoanaerobaculia bacterium]
MRTFIAVLAALLTLSCGRFGGLTPSSTTPVILISIDTLRSDRLPAYGYTGVSTPNLDALRKDSILYQRAYSHCPLTLPSHTSMLTGLLPSEHGVRDNVGYRLEPKIPTLPELLKKNGYATGSAISAYVLRRESGISRGFDSYDDQTEALGDAAAIGYVQRAGGETIKAAQQWLDKNAESPFFLFLHLYEPHTPYTPPEPFRSQYKDAYDGEIAYVDQLIGDFIANLQQRGLYDKAMIVLLSDHGEGLNDHGEEEHGVFLYREAIQVPLMVKMPKSAKGGETVAAPVQLIDVFPTILEQTKTPLPKLQNNARSLLAFLDEGIPSRQIYSETYYARLHFGWSDLHSLIESNEHYIHGPIPELFDVVGDPAEKKNTYADNRRASFRMRNAITPLVKAASAPTQIDPEEAAKLAALGYVGSTVSTSDDEELPDPKTTIGTFRQIKIAFTHFRDLRLEECLKLVDELLADNDKIVDIWDLKSKALSKLGRNEEAIAAAREGLKRQPNAVGLIMAVANLSIMTGELAQAEQHADLLLKTDPARTHEIRARVAAQRNDYETAKKEAELALKDARDPSIGLMTLGLISKQQNQLEPALKYFDQAAQSVAKHKNQKIPNLQLYRGDLLARLGRNREAEEAFRTEIAAYPQQPEAYGSLILLLSSEGRVDEATKLVFKLVEAAPLPPSYVTISETLKAVGDDRGAVYWARQGVKKFPKHRVLQSLSRTFTVAG